MSFIVKNVDEKRRLLFQTAEDKGPKFKIDISICNCRGTVIKFNVLPCGETLNSAE